MSKFILKIVLFFLLVFVLDYSIGYCLDYMNSHQKGNFTKDLYHGIMQSNEDILIFGSSRAMNHYVPNVIVAMRVRVLSFIMAVFEKFYNDIAQSLSSMTLNQILT